MPKYGSLQTVQAKLDPTGTYLVYRISGSWPSSWPQRSSPAHRSTERLVRWILMVVGMMWQFVVSLAVLRHELGGLHWSV